MESVALSDPSPFATSLFDAPLPDIVDTRSAVYFTWIPYEEAVPAERMWQRRFDRFRKRGEWFEIDAREVANLAIRECQDINRKTWERKMRLFGDYMESVGHTRNPTFDELSTGNKTRTPLPLSEQRRLIDEYRSIPVYDKGLAASIDRSHTFLYSRLAAIQP